MTIIFGSPLERNPADPTRDLISQLTKPIDLEASNPTTAQALAARGTNYLQLGQYLTLATPSAWAQHHPFPPLAIPPPPAVALPLAAPALVAPAPAAPRAAGNAVLHEEVATSFAEPDAAAVGIDTDTIRAVQRLLWPLTRHNSVGDPKLSQNIRDFFDKLSVLPDTFKNDLVDAYAKKARENPNISEKEILSFSVTEITPPFQTDTAPESNEMSFLRERLTTLRQKASKLDPDHTHQIMFALSRLLDQMR